MENAMKIVGVGLNKTGTSTLGVCMRTWGMRHLCFTPETFDMWRENNIEGLLSMADGFDSFEDWPWPLVYREFDRRFPGSKFILTKRLNADAWFTSLCKHAARTGPTRFREAIYGYAMPEGHKAEYIRFYQDHLAAVRGYFANRPGDLLEVCWEDGDGWQKLSDYLGLPDPGVPFPHANKSPPKTSGLVGRMRRAWWAVRAR